MARNRTSFTDEQRAEIYRLDRATCSFTGRNLWILDYGMDPSYAIDWIDHITPASKGGKSEIENGATASWFLNWMRGDSIRPQYLFHRGRPTGDFRWYHGDIPNSIYQNLTRFANLQQSDWYLNRGLWQIWLACHVEYEVKCGHYRSRRKKYFTTAAANSLSKWRTQATREGTESIDRRGLSPTNPEPDQEMLVSATHMTTQQQLLKLVNGLMAAYSHAAKLISMLHGAETVADLERARRYEAKQKDIPQRISNRARRMIEQLEMTFCGVKKGR